MQVEEETGSAALQMIHFIGELSSEYAHEFEGYESACGSETETVANMPDYKSFKFIDNSTEIRGAKRGKRTSRKDGKKGDVAVRMLPASNGLRKWKDPTATCPNETDENKGRKKVYIKKDLVDSYMPEMVAFLHDSSYDFVKDIFVDTEVHCREDICLAESCDLDHHTISSMINPDDEETRGKSIKGNVESVASISAESRLIAEDDSKINTTKQPVSENSMMENKDETDRQLDPSSIDSTAEKIIRETWPENGLKEEARSLPNSTALSTTAAVDCNCPTSQAETSRGNPEGSIIQCADCQANSEDSLPEILTSSRRSSVDQHDSEESSFTSADPPSGSIDQLSGPMSFSVSVSGSSNCSSSSSHSFAFPILPTEWIDSPVRMASADRKQLQRHRCWRKRLLCCKF